MTNDLKIPIIAGTLTLLGGVLVAYLNNNSQLKLAQKKHDVDLIIKALESDTPSDRLEMLQLLTETHLLNDADIEKNIQNYARYVKLSNIPQAANATVSPETAAIVEVPLGLEKGSPIIAPPATPITNPSGGSFEKISKAQNNISLAKSYEKQGFAALVNKDLDKAIECFTKSENSYNGFHMAYDIGFYLSKNPNKVKLQARDIQAWKNVYQKILKDYSWRMPEDAKAQLTQLSN